MVMPRMDVLLYDFFSSLYSERCLGPKSLLIKRPYSALIETIQHNKCRFENMILRVETLTKKKEKDVIMSLLELFSIIMPT